MSRERSHEPQPRGDTARLDLESKDALYTEATELAADHGLSQAAAYERLSQLRATPAPGRRPLTDAYVDTSTAIAPVLRKATSREISSNADEQLRRASQSAGQPLPSEVRDRLERSLGEDLSRVRIHTGDASAAAAQAIAARAYTQGQEIHFATGEFDPTSTAGQRLLAHEVAHTVQQRGVSAGHQNKLEISQPGDALEQQADAFADAFVSGQPAVTVEPGTAPGNLLARDPGDSAGSEATADEAALGTDRDAFSDAFNREFAAQLHAFATGGEAAAERGPDVGAGGDVGVRSGPPVSATRLRQLFTASQREKLTSFFAPPKPIPDRLFNGDDVGNATAQQRILLSGHILANGTYTPGSFSQRMYARMCGHWANLVLLYAGAGDGGGRGIREEFDHEGDLALATGEREGWTGERMGAGEHGPGDRAPERSRFEMRGLSMAELNTLQAGDWIWYFNDNGGAGGNHSVIFSRWASEPQPATDRDTGQTTTYRRAICMSQRNPSEGGIEHTALLGEDYIINSAGHRITPVTHWSRVSADAHPVRTAEDLRQVLGTGPDATRNQQFIDRLLRRHPGQRMNWEALAADIRARNTALLQRLTSRHRDRMTDGQIDAITELNDAALEENSENSNITTLCRLNDRLQAWIANADALETGEDAQRGRVESRRQATEEETGPERERLEQEIEEADREVAALEDAQRAAQDHYEEIDVSDELHAAWRQRAAVRAERRTARAEWRATRDTAARAAIDTRLTEIQSRLDPIEAESTRLEGLHRERRAEVREARREARSFVGRLNRANRQRDRLVASLGRLESASGRYTVHSADRGAFQGRGETREARSGLLENLRPQPNWSSLLVSAEGDGAPAASDAD